MTQSSLVGGFERLRGICCVCFQGRENFLLEDGSNILFRDVSDYVPSCICTMSRQSNFQIHLSLSWRQLMSHCS
jgi:hypothetical protein